MNVKDAAIQILKEAGKPLHREEIAARIIKAGLWKNKGKTRTVTRVSQAIYSDIRKNKDKSIFIKIAPRIFSLRALQLAEVNEDPSSFLEAAEKVLDQFGNRKPIHYQDITDKALSQGWLKTLGKTPEATMNSSIRMELKKAKSINEPGRFFHASPGHYGLAKWRETSLLSQISKHNQNELENEPEDEVIADSVEPYSVDKILSDGCFIGRSKLEKILERLRTKKNLILQGPPGTGKTWLAKRLAFALMGQKDDSRVRAVQFHPNLSYEDFVRGWRPSGDGKLTLVDGPFVEMIRAAEKEINTKRIIVIEEINRGNPAQIFGEMLTLLEVDKRTPNEALELSYRREEEENERVFIPDNLYVIGTMNIADRSLALVDLALRRRFAFIDLKPAIGKTWKAWVHSQCGIDSEILDKIENRIQSLNSDISSDPSLGEQFSIGHSYVTPRAGIRISDAHEWFHQVVDTEIGPLLNEYWFDSLEKAEKAKEQLLKGF